METVLETSFHYSPLYYWGDEMMRKFDSENFKWGWRRYWQLYKQDE